MVLGRGAMLAQDADKSLLDACKAANALSVEALITPADTRQTGPARIISFSQDGYNRNFTLCQERDALVLRLRTTRTGVNGMKPQTELCKLRAGGEHHVIVTYRPGRLTCYLNGKRAIQTGRVRGDFSTWVPMHLLFGDEWKDRRCWSGRLRGIAISAREIGPAEAAARYKLAIGKGGR